MAGGGVGLTVAGQLEQQAAASAAAAAHAGLSTRQQQSLADPLLEFSTEMDYGRRLDEAGSQLDSGTAVLYSTTPAHVPAGGGGGGGGGRAAIAGGGGGGGKGGVDEDDTALDSLLHDDGDRAGDRSPGARGHSRAGDGGGRGSLMDDKDSEGVVLPPLARPSSVHALRETQSSTPTAATKRREADGDDIDADGDREGRESTSVPRVALVARCLYDLRVVDAVLRVAARKSKSGGLTSKAVVDSAKKFGVGAVLGAMREYPNRAGVQWRALNVLREMASESGVCASRVSSLCCLDPDVVGAVVVADGMRAQIAIHGGIGAVLIAMRSFPKDLNTQHFGARVIMNLAFKSGA
jgi:hypothetical protein